MSRTWHVITGEYPPSVGGVADHTKLVAEGLAGAGDDVHVWCWRLPGAAPASVGEDVDRAPGSLHLRDLAGVSRAFGRNSVPRNLLVQWVPHAFGWRSLNVTIPAWLWRRARRGDVVDVIVHEPFLAFREGGWRQDGAAAVHRLMVVMLLRAARRVWVTIPAWERALRPFAPRRVAFGSLPVPSSVPVVDDEDGVAGVRARYDRPGTVLAGHFGTYGPSIVAALDALVPALPSIGLDLLLLGRGGDLARRAMIDRHGPLVAARIHAPGVLDVGALSRHLQACDILVQPYPDGASGRRTSLMAGLAHGRAVITTTGRLSEPFWKESGAIRTVPAGDTDALVTALRDLAADPAARDRLGDEARALYDARFDIRHTVNALRRD